MRQVVKNLRLAYYIQFVFSFQETEIIIQTLTDRIEEDLDEIKAAVGNYQNKLKDAVAEIENETAPKAHQVKSSIVSI